jgi:hypothetical protein
VDGIQMTNDDFLSDIEKDINGDWKEIQADFQNQEKREYLKKHPEVPNISYKEFYKLIVDIFYSFRRDRDGHDGFYLRVVHILEDVFFRNFRMNDNNKKIPESFEQVWDIFCDHTDYRFSTSFCKRCDAQYDILYKEQRNYHFHLPRDRDYGTIKRSSIDVHCPLCSSSICSFMGAELIGIYQHKVRKEVE